jgi:predicted RNA-binding protein YlxR (DUF448 family)
MKPKKELLRIVRSPENIVSIDKTGKAAGRGCYICKSIDCLEKAVKAKRIQNALETQVDALVFEELRGQLNKSE